MRKRWEPSGAMRLVGDEVRICMRPYVARRLGVVKQDVAICVTHVRGPNVAVNCELTRRRARTIQGRLYKRVTTACAIYSRPAAIRSAAAATASTILR
jgi:hypothetical protein